MGSLHGSEFGDQFSGGGHGYFAIVFVEVVVEVGCTGAIDIVFEGSDQGIDDVVPSGSWVGEFGHRCD